MFYAPLAQLDRVLGFEPRGRRFESYRARSFKLNTRFGFRTREKIEVRTDQNAGTDSIVLDVANQHLNIDVRERDYGGESVLPVLQLSSYNPFISAAMLATKAKQFDDGVYAAVELIVEDGAGKITSKRELLKTIAMQLLENGKPPLQGSLNLLAACRLGGMNLKLSDDVEQKIVVLENEFLVDDKRSKPLSFYNWSPELRRIFQQDRLLQAKIRAYEHQQVISILKEQGVSNQYLTYLAFVSRLTNPVLNTGLAMYLSSPESTEFSDREEFSFFPPSASPEGELVKKLFNNQSIPDGFDLMQEVIDRIRSGQMDFTPTEKSGFYDYQLWSYEPFLIPERMPESTRMTVRSRYRRKLEGLFKGLYSLARETHIKQLEVPEVAGAAPPMEKRKEIVIKPQCTIEPLPSHYLRMAQSYLFLKSLLLEHLGEECLNKESRLTDKGRVKTSLLEELTKMIKLFYGAHCQASFELGLPAVDFASEYGRRECLDLLNNWLLGIKTDEDLSQDTRMMVPVFYDLERKLTKVWLFMGWSKNVLKISYRDCPELLEVNGEKPDTTKYDIVYGSSFKGAFYPAFAEVYVDRIFDRDEFRSHCDRYKTVDKIIANLPGARTTQAAEIN